MEPLSNFPALVFGHLTGLPPAGESGLDVVLTPIEVFAKR
jgi:hypothetical protein